MLPLYYYYIICDNYAFNASPFRRCVWVVIQQFWNIIAVMVIISEKTIETTRHEINLQIHTCRF